MKKLLFVGLTQVDRIESSDAPKNVLEISSHPLTRGPVREPISCDLVSWTPHQHLSTRKVSRSVRVCSEKLFGLKFRVCFWLTLAFFTSLFTMTSRFSNCLINCLTWSRWILVSNSSSWKERLSPSILVRRSWRPSFSFRRDQSLLFQLS